MNPSLRLLLFLYIVIGSPFFANAQVGFDESTASKLAADRMEDLIKIIPSNVDTGLLLLPDLLVLAEQEGDQYVLDRTHQLIGYCQWRRGEILEAIPNYMKARNASSLALGEEGIAEEKYEKYKSLLLKSSLGLVDMYSAQNKLDSAELQLQVLESLVINMNFEPSEIGQLYQSKVILYNRAKEYDKTINSALQILQLDLDTSRESKVYQLNANMIMGGAYKEIGDYVNCMKYYEEALKIGSEGALAPRYISPVRHNYSLFLMETSEHVDLGGDGINKQQKYLDRAKVLIQENLAVPNLHEAQRAYYQSGLAEVYFYEKNYQESLKIHTSSKDVFAKYSYPLEYAGSLVNMATCDLKLKQYAQGIANAEEGLKILKEEENIYHIRFAHETLAVLYEEVGNYKKSIEHHKEYTAIEDSIFNEEKVIEIADLEANHQLYKKEKELEVEKKELALSNAKSEAKSRTIWGITIGASLLLVSLFFLWQALGKNKEVNRKLIKQSEIIKDSLKEKEALLREVHHRVKNNLQVVSGMLQLQADKIDDPRVDAVMQEGQERIKSMAMIHQKFYEGERLRDISFSDYLRELTGDLADSYGIDKSAIDLTIETDEERFNIDTSIPLGIIVNELISNAYKHAFNAKVLGKIDIELKKNDKDSSSLIISDNGVGLPDDFDLSKTQSMGLKLVRILVQQMKGSLEYFTNEGAKFVITFPSQT